MRFNVLQASVRAYQKKFKYSLKLPESYLVEARAELRDAGKTIR